MLVTHTNVTREHDVIGCELVVLLLILMCVWGSVCFVCILLCLTDSSESILYTLYIDISQTHSDSQL